jgi:methylmalonyl-CoA epimerase
MKIHHLGLAVRSLEEATSFYRDALGLVLSGTEEVRDEGVRVSFLPAGEARVELLEAIGKDSPIARFLEKRGEGIHHVCFEVPDLEAALSSLREGGAELIQPEIRVGAGGDRIAFVHPRSSHGVLVELKEVQAAVENAPLFHPGSVVVLYLDEPPSKIWGVLRSLDATGVAIEGIDLRSHEEWMRGVLSSELTSRDVSVSFYPLGRVTKILLDRGTEAAPSLQDQFLARTGRRIQEFLAHDRP